MSLHRGPVPTATTSGQYRAMNFVHGQLAKWQEVLRDRQVTSDVSDFLCSRRVVLIRRADEAISV